MSALLPVLVQIEQEWLSPLYRHVHSLFSGTNLPSHDAEHHLRVWLNCRQLLLHLEASGIDMPADTARQCFIACFFHDTGLLQEIGDRHGAESRLLCQLFLAENPQFTVDNPNDMLDAIEKHDDKRERRAEATCIRDIVATQRLVSTADDMDAFGCIGVFRYAEIYLKRGIPAHQIPQKAMTNLKSRFNNFWQSYSLLHRLAPLQKARYSETLNFFTHLDAGGEEQNAVFNILSNFISQPNTDVNTIVSHTLSTNQIPYVVAFMNNLISEGSVTNSYKTLIT